MSLRRSDEEPWLHIWAIVAGRNVLAWIRARHVVLDVSSWILWQEAGHYQFGGQAESCCSKKERVRE